MIGQQEAAPPMPAVGTRSSLGDFKRRLPSIKAPSIRKQGAPFLIVYADPSLKWGDDWILDD
jgi:hypothetical protein